MENIGNPVHETFHRVLKKMLEKILPSSKAGAPLHPRMNVNKGILHKNMKVAEFMLKYAENY